MKENIDTVAYASLLYDFYGNFLDESKREIMDLYHDDDFSLAEIAEKQGMSRQGVHYALKKAEFLLEECERKFGLIARWKQNSKLAEEAKLIIDRLLDKEKITESQKIDLKRLAEIIKEITE